MKCCERSMEVDGDYVRSRNGREPGVLLREHVTVLVCSLCKRRELEVRAIKMPARSDGE